MRAVPGVFEMCRGVGMRVIRVCKRGAGERSGKEERGGAKSVGFKVTQKGRV